MQRDSANLTAFGAFIRERRTRLDLTQAQLVQRVGWNQERISLLENGKYGMPSLPGMVRLASALDVPVADFVRRLGYSLDISGPGGPATEDNQRSTVLQYALQHLLAIDSMTLKEALDQASDQLATAMGADKIDAFLYDAPTNSLVALGTSNTAMGRLQHRSGLGQMPLVNRERAAQVFETGEVFRTGDARSDPHISTGMKETLGVQSMLAAPLRSGSRIMGVLTAESASPDRFDAEDQQFFVAVSRWVGMIAHRAELVEAMRASVAEDARRQAAEEVITSLAHDLGNMLTPLRGRLSILRRRLAEPGHERELEHAEEANRSVTRIQRLINSLLDVSRLDHGLFALNLQPLDLSALVEDVAEELRPAWPELVVRGSDSLEVDGDPVRLREVLVNLVTNAMQHSPSGSPIVLGAGAENRPDGRFAVVSVTDEGPGIDPDLLPHLFDRFARRHDGAGLGLGLYLSRRLVEAHGGTLTVETAEARGATFWVAVPCRET